MSTTSLNDRATTCAFTFTCTNPSTATFDSGTHATSDPNSTAASFELTLGYWNLDYWLLGLLQTQLLLARKGQREQLHPSLRCCHRCTDS